MNRITIMIVLEQHLWVFVSKCQIELTLEGLVIEAFCDFTAPLTGLSENVAHWDFTQTLLNTDDRNTHQLPCSACSVYLIVKNKLKPVLTAGVNRF